MTSQAGIAGQQSLLSQEDYGAYKQSPLIHFLRNVSAPALAKMFVQEFRNAQYIIDNKNNAEIMNMNLFQLLRKIHNKGKKFEEKRKKKKSMQAQDPSLIGKTLHINNVKTNEHILEKISVEDLINENADHSQIENELLDIDMTFLLNLLTNEILGFNVDFKPLEAMKSIRNKIFHSGSDTGCTKTTLEKLCEATKEVYNFLGLEDDLDAKKEESLRFSQHLDILACPIIDDLCREVSQQYQNGGHAVLPSVTVTHTGYQTEVGNIGEYIYSQSLLPQGQRTPMLLCGSSGSGKTSILLRVADSLCQLKGVPCFMFVLYMKLYDHPTQAHLWEEVLKSIEEQCPETVERYDIALILDALRMYGSKILFLVDWNVNDTSHIPFTSMMNGTWVVTYQGDCESSTAFQTLQVKPLTEGLVQNILSSLNEDEKELKYILDLFKECNYKGLLNTPEMVNIFNEIRRPIPSNKMLEYYIEKKIECMKILESDLLYIEELAFKTVINNMKFYKEEDFQSVKPEIKMSFFSKHVRGLSFRYRVIEDFFAARFLVREKEDISQWFEGRQCQIPLFKRIFRLACDFWCQNDNIGSKLSLIKPYIFKIFGVNSILQKVESTNQNAKSSRKRKYEDIDDKILKDDSETFWYKNAFTKWTYLVSLVEACGGRQEMVMLMAEIIAQKDVWLFKCKFLNEEKIQIIEKVIRNVEYIKPITVKLESGVKSDILNMLWNMLGNLPLKQSMSVQINIVGRNNCQVPLSDLKDLITKIVQVENPHLQLCKYVGPFVYKGKADFLKCPCVKDNMQILDVSIRDIASFAEILNCDELTKLMALEVKVDLKSITGDSKELKVHKDKPPTLTVKYCDDFQDLLYRIKDPKYLKYLSIDGIVIKDNFHIDLKAFKNLECLYMKCHPKDYQRNSKISIDPESMEVDGIEQNDTTAQILPLNEWGFRLAVRTALPEGLERLMLRNMGFCNDSNIFILLENWKNLQRIMILDTIVSIAGANTIVRKDGNQRPKSSSVRISDDDDDDNVGSEFKKKCALDSFDTYLKEEYHKCPRLTKDERLANSKKKPEGRELVITSEQGLCPKCSNFPCSCKRIPGEDIKDTFEDIISFIKSVYECDYLSFSYTNRIFTVSKNINKDLRVHIPLYYLGDDALCNLQEKNSLKVLCKVLNLAQYISLEHTSLSHNGAMKVVKLLKESKSHGEPFSLTITSTVHPCSAAEVRNSAFIHFLRSEACLTYFQFECLCKKRCHSIKKSHQCDIYFNGDII